MSTNEQHGHRIRQSVVAVSVLLVLIGVSLVVVALKSQRHAPQPPASAGIASSSSPAAGPTSTTVPAPPGGSTKAARPSATTRGPVLPASDPTQLDIPAIHVTSDLLRLGISADHTVQVPPLSRDSRAGWYQYSPAPGQLGPAVILGHVDSAAYGPGVFFRLGALRPADLISVTRADHRVAVFRVERVVAYPKNHFPTLQVYGNTDHAALRLITCGGKFDFTTHNYLSNIVVYASLVSSHPA